MPLLSVVQCHGTADVLFVRAAAPQNSMVGSEVFAPCSEIGKIGGKKIFFSTFFRPLSACFLPFRMRQAQISPARVNSTFQMGRDSDHRTTEAHFAPSATTVAEPTASPRLTALCCPAHLTEGIAHPRQPVSIHSADHGGFPPLIRHCTTVLPRSFVPHSHASRVGIGAAIAPPPTTATIPHLLGGVHSLRESYTTDPPVSRGAHRAFADRHRLPATTSAP